MDKEELYRRTDELWKLGQDIGKYFEEMSLWTIRELFKDVVHEELNKDARERLLEKLRNAAQE